MSLLDVLVTLKSKWADEPQEQEAVIKLRKSVKRESVSRMWLKVYLQLFYISNLIAKKSNVQKLFIHWYDLQALCVSLYLYLLI